MRENICSCPFEGTRTIGSQDLHHKKLTGQEDVASAPLATMIFYYVEAIASVYDRVASIAQYLEGLLHLESFNAVSHDTHE